MRIPSWSIAILVVLAGCSSTPPISYYTLDMTRSNTAELTATLDIEGIRTSESLNRSNIQIQASATRIEYYATHEWAGGIGEMIRRKLQVELASDGQGSPRLTLAGTLLECGQVDASQGADALMSIAVTIRDSELPRYETPLIEKTYTSTRSMGKRSPDEAAQALSRCAEQIAAEIAADIQALNR